MTGPRVLLTSVFGPYCRDDEFGSRRLNPMELYHNQVTRVQGPFSLRMFHRSWGLMLIQSNIEAPCTVLDFPDLERFVEEIRDHEYDIVGIGSIVTNHLKVKRMCELVRLYRPDATIVVGGHVASIPDLDRRIDADHIVRGEGVRWFREYLGEDPDRPIRHPEILSGVGTRTLGTTPNEGPGDIAATLIPSVGCPLGCNFCSTSAMFGGKGKVVRFFVCADELFEVMTKLEESMNLQSFFVMDENFLLDRKLALRLLSLMRENDKAWTLYVFSSAKVLASYRMEELLGLGVSWVWMGLEGKDSRYRKLEGVDTFDLTRRLRENGIKVLGSTIVGLEDHTPENIDAAIEHGVRHGTDFHQFMLYMPMPGTPLHEEMAAEGRVLAPDEFPYEDTHGQLRFNYRHPEIPAGEEEALLERAFERDFEVNGPSIARIVRTMLRGWRRYRRSPDARIRRRIERESEKLGTMYAAVIGACVRHYRRDPVMHASMREIRDDLVREFGWRARILAAVGGRFLSFTMKREAKRLARGLAYEPPTFYERNAAAMAVEPGTATLCRQVETKAPVAEPVLSA
jgi:radical SAM superfamily enzyme YgiQ (UPF0313 family)